MIVASVIAHDVDGIGRHFHTGDVGVSLRVAIIDTPGRASMEELERSHMRLTPTHAFGYPTREDEGGSCHPVWRNLTASAVPNLPTGWPINGEIPRPRPECDRRPLE